LLPDAAFFFAVFVANFFSPLLFLPETLIQYPQVFSWNLICPGRTLK